MSMEGLNASLAPDDEMADRMIGDYQNAEVMIFGELHPLIQFWRRLGLSRTN